MGRGAFWKPGGIRSTGLLWMTMQIGPRNRTGRKLRCGGQFETVWALWLFGGFCKYNKNVNFFLKKRGKYNKSGYKFVTSTLAFPTSHTYILSSNIKLFQFSWFHLQTNLKTKRKMRASPSVLGFFFFLASIGISHPLSPIDQVTQTPNLVN